jgi:aminoglycoside phosphotransferase (APT) family kinase protein
MVIATSNSHIVYMSTDVVVKIIDASRHTRLEREIALAPHLPIGVMPPVLASGLYRLDSRDLRYACYERVPGTTPGMGMPDVDSVTARLLAEQAARRLVELHRWTPSAHAEQTLGEPLDHGGFVNRAALLAKVESLAALDRDAAIPSPLLDGLMAIAEHAPLQALVDIPVHADCHWGNWLALDRNVTALLDFEWARFGEPIDDWFFLARFSGPHVELVLDVIAREANTPREVLRAGCEVRDAAHLANDLCVALEHPGGRARMAAQRIHALEELVVGRYWWRGAN